MVGLISQNDAAPPEIPPVMFVFMPLLIPKWIGSGGLFYIAGVLLKTLLMPWAHDSDADLEVGLAFMFP